MLCQVLLQENSQVLGHKEFQVWGRKAYGWQSCKSCLQVLKDGTSFDPFVGFALANTLFILSFG